MDKRDLLIDDTGKMVVRGGTLATGPSLHQEVQLLLQTCKGEWRHDPLAGCDLVKRMGGRIVRSELERIIRVQVERDGKSWPMVRDGIRITSNGA